jgi:flagellar biosynthesis protein FlhB
MDFLGHVLSQEGVRPDLRKIESIKEWKNLISIKRVWLFLGLANFYRKFINDFFALVKPLTNLWKKEGSFEWKEE